MSTNKYETLNQERKIQKMKKKLLPTVVFPRTMKTKPILLKANSDISVSISNVIPIGNCTRFLPMKVYLAQIRKSEKEFNSMIECAKNGDFDLIITKEISRFARNTLDSIFYTRDLKKHGVGVIFLNDNINTLDGDAELRLAIMSSIAQEESRKTSERVKWGQKRQMEQGVVFGRSMLGYDVKDGKMTINEEGAKSSALSSTSLWTREKVLMLLPVSFGRKALSLCVLRNGKTPSFSVLSAMKNTAAI